MFTDKLRALYSNIQAVARLAGRGEEVKVVFATKYLNKEGLAAFIDEYWQLRGEIVFIGENKVQDAQEKFSYLSSVRPDLVGKYYRVMIGNLQKNKINKALGLFDEIWGVDSRKMLREINDRVLGKKLPVFLEINVSGEVAKHGVSIEETDEAIREIKELPNISLGGLMTMAPESGNREEISKVFRTLKECAERYSLKTSMGMSGDWREAVRQGSEYLRIGSAIFR